VARGERANEGHSGLVNWSARLFFFLLLGFVVYVFASGDQAKWTALFTKAA
jgi:hypothetical protein